jgi:hypothetical protein
MIDRLNEQGVHPVRIHNGAASDHPGAYYNLGAQIWADLATLIERRLVRLPNDERIIRQATTRQKRFDSAGRLRLEAKEELRERGVESPDYIDAFAGAVHIKLMADKFAFNPVGREQLNDMYEHALDLMTRDNQAQIASQIVQWGGEGGMATDFTKLW